MGRVTAGNVESDRGVDDKDVTPGYMITGPLGPIHSVCPFVGQLAIPNHKNFFCPLSSVVMHCRILPEVMRTVSDHIFLCARHV